MAETLSAAQQLAAKAKKYRETKGTEELAAIQAAINSLKVKADAQAAIGRSYLQLTTADGALMQAVQTLQGKVYLKQNGFEVEDMRLAVNIWWEDTKTIDNEREEILNPKPKDPIVPIDPTPTTPVVTEPTTGTTPAT